jgi:hypothetical protein
VPQQLFVFIQMEFPWALGPTDGRYLMRAEPDGDAERVVVVATVSSRRAREAERQASSGGAGRMMGRLAPTGKSREATPEPAPVSTTRVTVIDPVPLSAEHQAQAWLEELDREHDVDDALGVVNHVIRSHRIAAADPYVHEVSAAQALVIRAGWGEGEKVADGRWLQAQELPIDAARTRRQSRRLGGSKQRTAALRPQERLAALLGRHTTELLCEDLVLRARLDLDHGRIAHATLELRSALSIAVAELSAEGRQDLTLRIAELEQLRSGVEEQAAAAHSAGAGVVSEDVVSHALERLEAALRARTAPGFRLK